jgi:hypothetical protein
VEIFNELLKVDLYTQVSGKGQTKASCV